MLDKAANSFDESVWNRFMSGECHIFAEVLHEKFGYPLAQLLSTGVASPNRAIHVLCLLDSDYIVDVREISHEAELSQYNYKFWDKPDYKAFPTNSSELRQRYSLDCGGGLRFDDFFVESARLAAINLINRYWSYYDGQKKEPIPEFAWRNGGNVLGALGPVETDKP